MVLPLEVGHGNAPGAYARGTLKFITESIGTAWTEFMVTHSRLSVSDFDDGAVGDDFSYE
jgi:hypothetical protein